MRYRELIVEKIVGLVATVYHRTKTPESVVAIKGNGFLAGEGATYGKGIYATYDFESQLNWRMWRSYGPFVVRANVRLYDFLIFDYDIAKQIYGDQYRLIDQIKRLGPFVNDIDDTPNDTLESLAERLDAGPERGHFAYTAEIAKQFVDAVEVTQSKARGLVYTGAQDGRCVVVYDTKAIFPRAVTKIDVSGSDDKDDDWYMQKKVEFTGSTNPADYQWEPISAHSHVKRAYERPKQTQLPPRQLIKLIKGRPSAIKSFDIPFEVERYDDEKDEHYTAENPIWWQLIQAAPKFVLYRDDLPADFYRHAINQDHGLIEPLLQNKNLNLDGNFYSTAISWKPGLLFKLDSRAVNADVVWSALISFCKNYNLPVAARDIFVKDVYKKWPDVVRAKASHIAYEAPDMLPTLIDLGALLPDVEMLRTWGNHSFHRQSGGAERCIKALVPRWREVDPYVQQEILRRFPELCAKYGLSAPKFVSGQASTPPAAHLPSR